MQVSSGWCDIGGPRVRPILIEWGSCDRSQAVFSHWRGLRGNYYYFFRPCKKKFFKLCNLVQLNLKEVR